MNESAFHATPRHMRHKEQFSTRMLRFAVTTFLLFMAFSFVGWTYEIANDAIVRGGFHARASLAGPWCPIYGFGGLLIVAVLHEFPKHRDTLFEKLIEICASAAIIAVLVTAVELLGSYACEATMGYVPWDYSSSWLNYQGRIAPEFTIRFVIGGLFFLYAMVPPMEEWVKHHLRASTIVVVLLALLFIVDNALELVGIWKDVIPRDAEVFVK